MKKVIFTLIALVVSATSFAQLIANKTDNKVTAGVDLFNDIQLMTSDNWALHRSSLEEGKACPLCGACSF